MTLKVSCPHHSLIRSVAKTEHGDQGDTACRFRRSLKLMQPSCSKLAHTKSPVLLYKIMCNKTASKEECATNNQYLMAHSLASSYSKCAYLLYVLHSTWISCIFIVLASCLYTYQAACPSNMNILCYILYNSYHCDINVSLTVALFPYEEYSTSPYELKMPFCLDMEEWFAQSPQNVRGCCPLQVRKDE